MRNRVIIIFAFFFGACGTKYSISGTHDRLVDFQSKTVMDMDDLSEAEEIVYKSLTSDKFNPKTDTIRFDKDEIYISYLSLVNGCSKYKGDIEVNSDSIILELKNINGIECTEQRCDRLVFKIKNPENKKYKIKKW